MTPKKGSFCGPLFLEVIMLHDKRDMIIKVRLTPAEYNKLMVYAGTIRKPASSVVRSLILSLLYEQDYKTHLDD